MVSVLRLLNDKAIRTAFAVFIAYLFILQGVVGSFAQTAVNVTVFNPQHILCSPSGNTAADVPAHNDQSQTQRDDCLCNTLCRLAFSVSVALIDAPENAFHAPVFSLTYFPYSEHVFNALALRGRIAEPRAPPIFS